MRTITQRQAKYLAIIQIFIVHRLKPQTLYLNFTQPVVFIFEYLLMWVPYNESAYYVSHLSYIILNSDI
jgi:hypothetical protein